MVFKEGVWYLKRACGIYLTEGVWYLKRVLWYLKRVCGFK